MTARATSLDTYHDSAFQHGAGLQRQQIADLVKSRGPMTRREIAAELHMETSSVSGRTNELLEAGMLVELADKKPCPITKRMVMWVTHKDNVCTQRSLPI